MIGALKSLYTQSPKTSFNAYVFTCVSLLKNSRGGSIAQGCALHGHLIKMGISSDRYIAITLFVMYLNQRRSTEADEIRKDFNGFDLAVHNCLITANVEWSNMDEARRLFEEMPERNEVSWTALISGLMKCGRVEESMWYFWRNPFHNVVSWTAAISGLVQNGLSFDALKLFKKLLESGVMPNSLTFTSVFRACSCVNEFSLGISMLGLVIKVGFGHHISISNSLITLFLRMGEVGLARGVFDQMKKRDVVSWTAILDVYVEMGDLREARRIFDEMPERNEVSWSTMIARYNQSGYPEEAVGFFLQMVSSGLKPNISCLCCVISALANLRALQAGMSSHAHAIQIGIADDVYVSSSLIDLYCKCGYTMTGRLVFDSISLKNVVSWNSMISGYSLNGQMEEAMDLFYSCPVKNNVTWNSILAGYVESGQFDLVFDVLNRMLLSGQIPSASTFSSMLCACASTASLEKGKNFHAKAIKLNMHKDVFLGTALTDMYAKCGDMAGAKQIFSRMPEKNECSWTAIIQGLAENGLAGESIALFEELKRNLSVTPSELMLLAVLFACSHSGLVDKGLQIFNSMEQLYGVRPTGRHCTCVVDMLSRSGRLSEAEELIDTMPFAPETNALAALLSACTKYGNEEIAERTAKRLWQMGEDDSSGYVLMSNIYASAGRWIDVIKTRKLMKERGLKKSSGCSWVEVKNHVHCFYSEDGSHSQSFEIYEVLDLLRSEMFPSFGQF